MPRISRLRAFVSLLTGGYALALLLFLILRLVFNDSFWWLALLANFTPFYFLPFALLLPLALLFRAKRGVLLMLPLTLIGAIWFGRLYLPKAEAQPTAQADVPTLRVMSFNIWGDNPNLLQVEDWLREMQADVALTQEVPPTWAGEQVDALVETYPYQANQSVDIRYWGNNTWSQHPFTEVENFDLEDDGTPTHSRVVIEIAGQQIAVYNVHLYVPAGNGQSFVLYDETARNAQIRNLLRLLQDEPLPYIVAGDFNMSDQSLIYNELADAMTDSYREAGRGLGASWPLLRSRDAFGSFIPPLVRIDYIWHSAHFRTLNAAMGPYLGSDHLPVYATLALET